MINGVPGDILIKNWQNKELYLDIVVGNIFNKSYVRRAASERLYVASQKEIIKIKKYGYKDNIVQLAVETMGAIAKKFKNILQEVADRMATRRNKPYNVIISQLRAKIIGKLMKQNVEMILSAIEL